MALSKARAGTIRQDLSVPETFVSPSASFDAALRKRVEGNNPMTVLWGAPGRGKSTYLSQFKQDLEADDYCVLRHHYFLSPSDPTDDRTSFPIVANSLIDQLRTCLPALGVPADANQEALGEWLARAGDFLNSSGKPLVVIVDGLDHVFREYRTSAHLDHLFSRLLPLPDNVRLLVGTQKVGDEHLPAKLLSECPRSDWLELPRLDEEATRKWVEKKDAIAALPAPDGVDREEWLTDMASALFEVSGGHPLHLTYTFEQAAAVPEQFGPERIRSLPACPDGDMAAYYRSLWRSLRRGARSILQTLAHAGFKFPNVSSLCEAAGSSLSDAAIDEVEFLLSVESGDVVAFHSSLMAFVRQTERFEEIEAETLKRVQSWLQTSAPDYYRWAWQSILNERLGDGSDLVLGPSYDWMVESFARGAPAEQMARILGRGARAALAAKNYARAQQLRHMEIRVLNGFDFQMTERQFLYETVLHVCEDRSFRRELVGDLKARTIDELVTLSRFAHETAQPALAQTIRQEFVRRQKTAAKSRRGYRGDFERAVAGAICSAVASGKLDHGKVLGLVDKVAETDIVLDAAIASARQGRDGDLLKKIRGSDALSRASDADMVDVSLIWVWQEEGLPVAGLIDGLDGVSPMLAVFAAWASGTAGDPQSTELADLSGMDGEYLEYSGPPQLVSGFVDAFFLGYWSALGGEVSVRLDTSMLTDPKWSWSLGVFDDFEAAGAELGSAGATSLVALYTKLQSVAPQWTSHSEAIRSQYQAFLRALEAIGYVLVAMERNRSGQSGLMDGDFASLSGCNHWNEERWLQKYLAFRENYLPVQSASELIGSRTGFLERNVTQFDERALAWSQLAALARRHGLPEEAARLNKRAFRCVISYGYHKDYFLWSVLDSIRACGEVLGDSIETRLEQIERVVLSIGEYTDGDETHHIPSHYNALVHDLAPQRAASLYDTHMEGENWIDAQDLLERTIRSCDLSSPFSYALAETAIDQGGPYALVMRSENEGGASVGLAARILAMTGAPARNSERPYSDTPLSDKEELAVGDYPPSDILRLATDLEALGWRTDARREIRKWIEHWHSAGASNEVLEAVALLDESGSLNRVLDRCADDIFPISRAVEGKTKAFVWLVRAHMETSGWSQFESGKAEVRRRFERIASDYRDRVDEFIGATSRSRIYRPGRDDVGPVLGYERLVLLLALCGRADEANSCTDALIDILVSETSDQPLENS